MNVLSFLTPKQETVYLDSKSTIREALEKYDYHRFTALPLVNMEGKYITTVSEGDILRSIKNKCDFNLKVAEEVLLVDIEKHRPYKALDINCSVQEVIVLSLEQNFIPMIDDRGMFIGIIKREEIIEYLYNHFKEYKDGIKIIS